MCRHIGGRWGYILGWELGVYKSCLGQHRVLLVSRHSFVSFLARLLVSFPIAGGMIIIVPLRLRLEPCKFGGAGHFA